MGGHGKANRSVHGRKFFDGKRIVHIPHTSAAVFCRNDYPKQPQRSQLLYSGLGKLTRFIPGHHVGRNLTYGKLANFSSEMFLVLRQHERI